MSIDLPVQQEENSNTIPQLEINSSVEKAMITDVPFMAQAYSIKGESKTNYVEPSFSMTSPAVEEVFKQYGITDADRMSTFKSNNMGYLVQQLDAHKVYKDSEKQLDELPMGEQIFAHVGAQIFNPINYLIAGTGAYKAAPALVEKVATFESTFINRLIATGINTVPVVADVVGQEYLTEKQVHAVDEEKLKAVGMFGGIVGLGGSGLGAMLTKFDSPTQRAIAQAATKAIDPTNIESVSAISRLEIGTASQLRNSHPVFRDASLDITHSNIAYRDKDTGEFYVQDRKTGADIKQVAEGHYNVYADSVAGTAKELNTNITDASRIIGDEHIKLNNAVEQDIFKNHIVNKTDDELMSTYEKATGTTIKVNDKGLKELPDDLYDVLYRHHTKENKALYKVPEVVKGAQTFYIAMSELATKLGLRGVAGKEGDFYAHRMWNQDLIESLGHQRATEMIVDAMKGHVLTHEHLQKGTITEADLVEKASAMVNAIKDNNLQEEFREPSFVSRDGAGNMTKHRVMRINTEIHPELLIRDSEQVAERYSQKMAGRLALKQVGIDIGEGNRNLSEAIENKIKEIGKKAEAEGATRKQIVDGEDNLRVAYSILNNTRQIVNTPSSLGHKTVATMKAANSAIFSAGFVTSAVGEFGSVMVKTLFSAMENFFPSHKIAIDIMKHKDNPLAKEFLKMNLGRQMIENGRFSRMDMPELAQTTTWHERTLQKIGHYSRKYSGFDMVTAVSDMIAGGSVITDLNKIAKRGSVTKNEREMFSRYGLSEKDILEFNTKAQITYSGKHPTALNIDSWADQAYADKITTVISRITRDTVLRGDGLNLPKYLSNVNSDFMSLLTQYQHFPMEAYERILLNGIAESPAKLVAGTIASMAIIGSMLKLEDEALFQLGVKKERQDDTKLAMRVINKIPPAAFLPDLFGAGMTVAGKADYLPKDVASKALGVTGSTINNAWKLQQKAISNKPFTNTDYDNLFRLSPFSRFPVYSEAIRGIISGGGY